MEMGQENYVLIHITLFLILCFYTMYGIFFFGLIGKLISLILEFIVWLFRDIIWKYLSIAGVAVYDNVLYPFWKILRKVGLAIWGFLQKVFAAIVSFGKDAFNIGKKVVNKVVDVGEAVYEAGKTAAIFLYHVGEDVVTSGITIIEAIWKFIKEKFWDIFSVIESIVVSIIDFFKGVAEFLTDGIESIFNLF